MSGIVENLARRRRITNRMCPLQDIFARYRTGNEVEVLLLETTDVWFRPAG